MTRRPHVRPSLDARLSEFARAILDPGRPVPEGLIGPGGHPSARRFGVYRNNVIAGLVEALKASFPVVHRLVGDEFFASMARLHVARTPPESPVMLGYGAEFPRFIDAFGPAASLPYLGDVARLERAWLEAYHAADAQPIAPAALAGIAAEQLPGLRLLFHPSLRLVSSPYPILAIWQANLGAAEPAGIGLGTGDEDILIVRPHAEVELRRLPAGAGPFIRALLAKAPIADAMNKAATEPALASILAGLLEAQAIIGWQLPGQRPSLSQSRQP